MLNPLLLIGLSLAASITEDRRTYADQTVQERWTWAEQKSPEQLVRKEWFHPDGERSRLEEYADGDLHGRAATWDRRGVLLTEEHWAAGQLHGPARTWSGPEGERWVEIELGYQDGVPHGEQLRRRDADTVQLRHRYQAGQLHGRQQAWHPNGEMHYDLTFVEGQLHGEQRFWETGELEPRTWMHFDQGRPHGQQRYFTQSDWREESWENGRWEQVVSRHEDGSTPERVRVYELEVQPLDRPVRSGERDTIEPARALYLETDKRLVSERWHWPDGGVREQHERTGERRYRAWAENGQLVVDGKGDPARRQGRWTEWRSDGSLHIEEDWSDDRKGERRVFDPQGRLREVETWEWERQRWQIYLYEGEHKVAEGELHLQLVGQRWGVWTYFRPDGSVRRIEEYGHGPYSGNRPYVHKSEEFRPDGSPWCSGDERTLLCVEPTDDGGRVEMTVFALQRPRGGFERYDRETFSFQPREIEPPELAETAIVVPVLDGRGVVRERRHLDANGTVVLTETFGRNGALERTEGADASAP